MYRQLRRVNNNNIISIIIDQRSRAMFQIVIDAIIKPVDITAIRHTLASARTHPRDCYKILILWKYPLLFKIVTVRDIRQNDTLRFFFLSHFRTSVRTIIVRKQTKRMY